MSHHCNFFFKSCEKKNCKKKKKKKKKQLSQQKLLLGSLQSSAFYFAMGNVDLPITEKEKKLNRNLQWSPK
jgi:hypothetical protein